jgi:hypothetical protein
MDISVRQRFLSDKFAITAGIKNVFNVTNLKMSDTGSVHGGGSGTTSTPMAMGTTGFVKLTLTL